MAELKELKKEVTEDQTLEKNAPQTPAQSVSVQDIVDALTFLQERVFNQENIQRVKDIAENLEVLGNRGKYMYMRIKNYVTGLKQGNKTSRSMELSKALHDAGKEIEALYAEFERAAHK